MYIYFNIDGVATKKVTTFAIGYPYKWEEFIGTTQGGSVLELLNANFCERGGHWEIQSEHEYSDIENIDELEDLGLTEDLRGELLKRGLTSIKFLENMDAIMAMTDRLQEDCLQEDREDQWEFPVSPEPLTKKQAKNE